MTAPVVCFRAIERVTHIIDTLHTMKHHCFGVLGDAPCCPGVGRQPLVGVINRAPLLALLRVRGGCVQCLAVAGDGEAVAHGPCRPRATAGAAASVLS